MHRHSLRRLVVAVSAVSLAVAVAGGPAAAAEVHHLRSSSASGSAEIVSDIGDRHIRTSVGFSYDARMNVIREVWLSQEESSSETGESVAYRSGDLADVAIVSLGLPKLDSATVEASGTWEVCVLPDWECSSEPVVLSATWSAVGPVLHFHQQSREMTVGTMRIGGHTVGSMRYQAATVTINGDALGGTSDPWNRPLLSNVTSGDTEVIFGEPEPETRSTSTGPIGAHLSGLSAWANFDDGMGGSTFVGASTTAYLDDGTEVTDAINYASFSILFDGDGNAIGELALDGTGSGTVDIQHSLASASAAGVVPVRMCQYDWTGEADTYCVDGLTVDVMASWTATEKATHTVTGTNVGYAGHSLYHYTGVTRVRGAAASATADGIAVAGQAEAKIQASNGTVMAIEHRPMQP